MRGYHDSAEHSRLAIRLCASHGINIQPLHHAASGQALSNLLYDRSHERGLCMCTSCKAPEMHCHLLPQHDDEDVAHAQRPELDSEVKGHAR